MRSVALSRSHPIWSRRCGASQCYFQGVRLKLGECHVRVADIGDQSDRVLGGLLEKNLYVLKAPACNPDDGWSRSFHHASIVSDAHPYWHLQTNNIIAKLRRSALFRLPVRSACFPPSSTPPFPPPPSPLIPSVADFPCPPFVPTDIIQSVRSLVRRLRTTTIVENRLPCTAVPRVPVPLTPALQPPEASPGAPP